MNQLLYSSILYSSIKNIIKTTLQRELSQNTLNLIDKIYENLSEEEQLKVNKHILPDYILSPQIDINILTTCKKARVASDQTKRCIARVSNGKQCSRTKTQNRDFCVLHIKSIPYGRIDQPINTGSECIHSTDSTDSKSKTVYSFDGLQQNDYIKTTRVTYEGKKYLIDEHGIFYSDDVDNNIVGKIEGDQILWFD